MYLCVQKKIYIFFKLKCHIFKALPILHPLCLQTRLSTHAKNAGHTKEGADSLFCACYVYSVLLDDEERKKRGKISLPSFGKAALLHYRECFLLVRGLCPCALRKRLQEPGKGLPLSLLCHVPLLHGFHQTSQHTHIYVYLHR